MAAKNFVTQKDIQSDIQNVLEKWKIVKMILMSFSVMQLISGALGFSRNNKKTYLSIDKKVMAWLFLCLNVFPSLVNCIDLLDPKEYTIPTNKIISLTKSGKVPKVNEWNILNQIDAQKDVFHFSTNHAAKFPKQNR